MDLSRFPRRRYTSGNTPIEHLAHLSAALGGPEIYVKRDDLLGLTSGGNKTRKLEFLMADALATGADSVITTGAVQSNHCRLTLAAAIKEGMTTHLVLEERVPGSYRRDASGNNFLYRLLGADISVVPAGTDLSDAMNAVAEQVRAGGGHPYVIPGGGSNSLGALGYVACAHEVMSQCFERGLPLDHIVCASGSGGTHAGLAAGLHLLSWEVPLTGISVRAAAHEQEPRLHGLATGIVELLGHAPDIRPERIAVRDDQVGPGYSLPTDAMVEAIQLFARLEGILLDPVYTGKAAAGLITMIREGALTKGQNVLFVHTGGSPALYADPAISLEGLE